MIDSSLTIIPIFIKFNLQVQKNAEWITNKLLQRQGDKKSVWICPAHPHTTYAFITKELRLESLLVKFQNNFFRHFTRIARRTHIGNSRSGQTGQVFFLNTQTNAEGYPP